MMRMRDPNGAWKPHPDDPRLLIRREPDEDAEDGEFYRILWEGAIRNYDGVTIKLAPELAGLDLNRNFPMEWAPEGEQGGAGPYPVSEPETRAIVQAVVDRPNITGHIAYHTFSGVHLRPYASYDDEHYPTFDLRAYKLLGEEATKRHRLPGRLGLPRLQVRPEADDQGLGATTGSTTTSASSRGRPSSGARSGRPGSRTTASSNGSTTTRRRTTSSCCAGTTRSWTARATSTGTRSSTSSSARSSSAAGTSCIAGATCRRSFSSERSRPTRTSRSSICSSHRASR